MKFSLKLLLFFLVGSVGFISCQSDKKGQDPGDIDQVNIRFADQQEAITYKLEMPGQKPTLGSNTLKLSPYTNYNVELIPMREEVGEMVDRSAYWQQRLDSLYVIFENFDVGINYSRSDLDSRGLPVGMESQIRTFAPGEGTLHFIVKHNVQKTQPYQTGEEIIDITIPVSVE